MRILKSRFVVLSKKKNKYNAKKTYVDDHCFDSKKEAAFYSELLLRQRAGEVIFIACQPQFRLPGGVKYKADFIVVESDGRMRVIDVKGMKTDIYKLKKRQVEAAQGFEIEEV